MSHVDPASPAPFPECAAREERLSAIFHNSANAIAFTELDSGVICDVNETWVSASGLSAEQALGKTGSQLGLWTRQKDRDACVGMLRDYGQVRDFETELVMRGEHRPYQICASVLRVHGLQYVLWELRDVSELKRSIQEHELLRQQLFQSQKLQSIGQLAGGVAHDFNNILAAMIMQLELLSLKRHPDPETTLLLKELQTEANRAASITRQLLMFSRRSLLELKVLDLNEVISNLLSMLRRLIGGTIEIQFTPGDSIPPVDADPTLIEQVVINIVANARDAMPRGGILTITTNSVQLDANLKRPGASGVPGRYAVVSLVDTGCGMDYLTLTQMFEPFFTTKPVGKGTGLGLATAHGIIAQHHGWIEAESEPGKGTVVRILLPESKRNHPGVAPTGPATGGSGHETILLVEDEPAVRRIAARGLRDLGYGVLEACDGPEALALWQRHQSAIDLIFTDMILPGGFSGSELVTRFRSAKPELRTIITSGHLAELAPASDQSHRPDHFLNKPYSLHTLAGAVREVLERRGDAIKAGSANAASI